MRQKFADHLRIQASLVLDLHKLLKTFALYPKIDYKMVDSFVGHNFAQHPQTLYHLLGFELPKNSPSYKKI